VLTYTLAVRSLDGAGAQARGVSAGEGDAAAYEVGKAAICSFPVTNTGAAGAGASDGDVYRLSVATDGQEGWSAELDNTLTAARAGETVNVPVYVYPTEGLDGLRSNKKHETVTLTATSESDPTKTATATCTVDKQLVKHGK